mmetsp:Transcript_6901/g.10850  ORF Transcript_6901/g.10850 Transcript_6901/m.10850 type:complete len:461 (-) Transcript_6901:1504-2886(-)
MVGPSQRAGRRAGPRDEAQHGSTSRSKDVKGRRGKTHDDNRPDKKPSAPRARAEERPAAQPRHPINRRAHDGHSGMGQLLEDVVHSEFRRQLEREQKLRMKLQKAETEIAEKNDQVEELNSRIERMVFLAHNARMQWTAAWMDKNEQFADNILQLESAGPDDMATRMDQRVATARKLEMYKQGVADGSRDDEAGSAAPSLPEEYEMSGTQRKGDIVRWKDGGEQTVLEMDLMALVGLPLSHNQAEWIHWCNPGEPHAGELIAIKRSSAVLQYALVFAELEGDAYDITVQAPNGVGRGRLRKVMPAHKVGRLLHGAIPEHIRTGRPIHHKYSQDAAERISEEKLHANMEVGKLLRLLDERPEDLRALCALGRLLEGNGDNTTASEYFERALKQDPDDYVTLTSFGRLLLSQGNRERATRLFRRAGVHLSLGSSLGFDPGLHEEQTGKIADSIKGYVDIDPL